MTRRSTPSPDLHRTQPLILAFTGMPAAGKGEAVAAARTAFEDVELPVVRMGDLVWERCRELGLELTPENVGRVANDERRAHGPEVWAQRTVEKIKEAVSAEAVRLEPPARTGQKAKPGPPAGSGQRVRPGPGLPSSTQPEALTGTPREAQPLESPPPEALTGAPPEAQPLELPPTPPVRPALPPPPAAIIDGLRSPAEFQLFRRAFGQRLKVVAITAPPSVRAARVGDRGRVDDTTDTHGFEARERRELDWGLGQVIKAADQTLANEGTLEELQAAVRKLVRELVRRLVREPGRESVREPIRELNRDPGR